MVSSPIKKAKGKQKIDIEKIEKKKNLSVAFSQRRMGLFKKASELSILCDAEILILVQSPAKKIYTFGNPSVESVLHRYQKIGSNFAAPYDDLGTRISQGRIAYLESLRRLKDEKEIEKKSNELHELDGNNRSWWDKTDLESMKQLHKMEEYLKALDRLKSKVLDRANELKGDNKLVVEFPSLSLTNLDDDSGRECDLVDMEFIEGENVNKSISPAPSSNFMNEKTCIVDESGLEISSSNCWQSLTDHVETDGCDFDKLGCLIEGFEVECFSNYDVAGLSSKFNTNTSCELVFTDSSCLEDILENSASGSWSCY